MSGNPTGNDIAQDIDRAIEEFEAAVRALNAEVRRTLNALSDAARVIRRSLKATEMPLGKMPTAALSSIAVRLVVLFSTLCSAVPAIAGSYTQPGSTISGLAGEPIPPGLYFENWTSTGCRTSPSSLCLTDGFEVFTWSTPVTIFGGRLQVHVSPTIPVWFGVENEFSSVNLYNPFAGVQLAWDLGSGFAVAAMLGNYFEIHNAVSNSSGALNPRLGLSYTGNGWNLSANNIFGIAYHPVTNSPDGSPCPPSPSKGCNSDFYNLDMKATRTFDKWEFGLAGYYSTDLNTPTPGYQKQSQFAVGPLVGYKLGPVTLQTYLTRDLYQRNYGGYDTRLWTVISFKIW
jgi:hypothetical protein